MQTAEDRKCPVLSPSFSSAPGKAGAGLSPWLRGEIPNKRKDLSKGSCRPVGASQTSVGGGGARSAGTIKELVPKGGGSLGVTFPVGCYGRDTSREKAHRLPGWTQSSWVQAKWDKEGTSKSPTRCGVWSLGGGSSSWCFATRSPAPQRSADNSGWANRLGATQTRGEVYEG